MFSPLTNCPFSLTLLTAAALPLLALAADPPKRPTDDKRQLTAWEIQAQQAAATARAAREAAQRAAHEAAERERVRQATLRREALEKLKLQQLNALKEAHILLAMADHDYKGFRHKAMDHVREAIKVIDESFLKNGTNGEKIIAAQSEIDAARARYIEQHVAGRENQKLSDMQLDAAGKILIQIHGSALQNNQARIADKIGVAISDLKTARRYR
jgi:hypothetical protein